MKPIILFFLFFLFFYSVSSKCLNDNYLEKISYVNGTLSNETVLCDFGCSNTFNTCRQPDLITILIIIFVGLTSFLLLGLLDYPFDVYSSVFFIVFSVLFAVSDFVSNIPRIIAILYIVIYISFLIVKVMRRDYE